MGSPYIWNMSEIKATNTMPEHVRHLLFWGALWSCFVLFGLRDRPSTSLVLVEECLNLLAYASIVYVNVYLLIPLFLSKKRVLLFVGALIFFVVLLTPTFTYLMQVIFRQFGEVELAKTIEMEMVFMAFSLVAILSTIFQILSEWFRHERDRRELEAQKTQSELRFLKSQINPHFLFNTLNNLYALTLKKSDAAPEIVLKLSDMMRYMLYECNEKSVPLSKEISYIQNYLDLEKIRQGNHVDIQFDVEGEIGNREVAPLLFIPFVENCFKHGVNRTLDNAFVHLQMKIQDNELIMDLTNSKPDTVPGGLGKRDGGIGLVNVRHQLQLLYPGRHKLKIEESPNTYIVHLKIKW